MKSANSSIHLITRSTVCYKDTHLSSFIMAFIEDLKVISCCNFAPREVTFPPLPFAPTIPVRHSSGYCIPAYWHCKGIWLYRTELNNFFKSGKFKTKKGSFFGTYDSAFVQCCSEYWFLSYKAP